MRKKRGVLAAEMKPREREKESCYERRKRRTAGNKSEKGKIREKKIKKCILMCVKCDNLITWVFMRLFIIISII